ncbi:hypothetical protein VNI00_016098 [Paramarasmius palmivorus]|uniref:Uncharacterized protein n=1 Tax=Paramarasmius palmivorus TaxID=297713 RepID=A0AAW0BG73_9AGAR
MDSNSNMDNVIQQFAHFLPVMTSYIQQRQQQHPSATETTSSQTPTTTTSPSPQAPQFPIQIPSSNTAVSPPPLMPHIQAPPPTQVPAAQLPLEAPPMQTSAQFPPYTQQPIGPLADSQQALPVASQALPSSTQLPTARPLPETPPMAVSFPPSSSVQHPAIQSVPSGFPVPAITPYSSVQMLEAVASGSQNPFPTLTSVQRANQTRLEHAQGSCPKNWKPRGKAQRPPNLVARLPVPSVERCLAMASGDVKVANIEVWIHPPQPTLAERRQDHNLPRNMYRYYRNEESYCIILKALNLWYQFTHLPVTTKLVDLVRHLSDALVQKGFTFPPASGTSAGFAPHEGLPLQLLSYTNLGRPNGGNKTPRLVSAAYRSETTLADIIANNREYAIAKWCICNQNYFLLHLSIRSPMTEAMVNLKEAHLGSDDVIRVHRCIGRRIYSIFRSDIDARVSEGYGFLNEDVMEVICDGNDDSDSEAEEQIVATSLTDLTPNPSDLNPPDEEPSASSSTALQSGTSGILPRVSNSDASSSISSSTSIRALSSQISSPSSTRDSGSRISSVSSTRSSVSHISTDSQDGHPSSDDPERSLEIWSFEFTSILDETLSTIHTPEGILLAVQTFYVMENDMPLRSLNITGTSIPQMARMLKNMIVDNLEIKDFSLLLNPDRHFIQTDVDSDHYVTSGSGIEREVFHSLASSYLKDRASEFFVQRLGDYSTLATIPEQSALFMSDTKRMELSVIGAIVGLSLVYGYPVDPINPLLLVYILKDCNVDSLTQSLVSTWFPDLFEVLSTWIGMTADDAIPTNVVQHLISYHDMQPSTLQGRSDRMHRHFSEQILRNAIIGPETATHPYFKAFIEGLRLPVLNGAMNLSRIPVSAQLARAFTGGVANFVCRVYSNSISGYSSLRIRYRKVVSDTNRRAFSDALSAHPFYQTKGTVHELVQDFLEGQGIPCPTQFEAVKTRFSPSINLGDIDTPTFRCRMLCWAATGVPFVLSEGPETEVRLVDETDTAYMNNLGTTNVDFAPLLNAGVCKFKTCSRLALIPASYLTKLLQGSYDSRSEEKDARTAIHHWLLVSILDNVGKSNVA